MKQTLPRGLLALLAATGTVAGVWAYFAPRNFHDTFPGGGFSWPPQLDQMNKLQDNAFHEDQPFSSRPGSGTSE